MYGFTVPGQVMREAYSYSEMRAMGFEGASRTDANYERYVAESEVSLDIPVTVKGLGSYDHVQTYDIEVEEAHCFYCDGYLTHNSAGCVKVSAPTKHLQPPKITSGSRMQKATGGLIPSEMCCEWQTIRECFIANRLGKNASMQFANSSTQEKEQFNGQGSNCPV